MFRDRDLFLLGAGALLSAFCLLLPLPFAGKLISGVFTLLGFMLLALLRLGPDRIPPEEWLRRRLHFRLSPRRFVYHRPGWRANFVRTPARRPAASPPAEPVLRPDRNTLPDLRRAERFAVSLALPERGVYPLLSALLAVLGIYFIAWLAQGGAEEIAAALR
jgi:hypothetical protein